MRWERERASAQRAWEEEQAFYGAGMPQAARFEELDTEDSEDGQHGVALGGHYMNGQANSRDYDPFLEYRRRSDIDRRRSDYSDFEIDGDTVVLGEHGGHGPDAAQNELRGKEDELLARAMERIRRARLLGKPNVRLPTPEHEVFQRHVEMEKEKKRKTSEKEAKEAKAKGKVKSKKPVEKKQLVETRRSRSKSGAGSALTTTGRRASSRSSVHEGVPIGPTPVEDAYRPGSRTSSQSRMGGSVGRRYVSEQMHSAASARRPLLPDDPSWQPRSRSNSAMSFDPSLAYAYDAYGQYGPPGSSSRPSSSRRNMPMPAEAGYATLPPQQTTPSRNAHLAQARAYGYESPLSRHQAPRMSAGAAASKFYAGEYYEEEEDDDGSDQGVQVDLRAVPSDLSLTDKNKESRNGSPKKSGSAVRSRRNTGKR